MSTIDGLALPAEVLAECFSYLDDVTDLACAERVCKLWRATLSSPAYPAIHLESKTRLTWREMRYYAKKFGIKKVEVAQKSTHLKTFCVVSETLFINDQKLSRILTNASRIQHLVIHDCLRLTDQALEEVATHCSHLESLTVSFCHKLKDEWPEKLRGLPTTLTTLRIGYCGRYLLNRLDLSAVGTLTSLKNLRLADLQDLETMTSLQNLTRLEKLAITHGSSSFITPSLPHLTNLKELDLSETFHDSLEGFSHLQNLETLDLSVCCITDVTPLTALASLSELDLSYNYDLENLPLLQKITSLKKLSLKCIDRPSTSNEAHNLLYRRRQVRMLRDNYIFQGGEH